MFIRNINKNLNDVCIKYIIWENDLSQLPVHKCPTSH